MDLPRIHAKHECRPAAAPGMEGEAEGDCSHLLFASRAHLQVSNAVGVTTGPQRVPSSCAAATAANGAAVGAGGAGAVRIRAMDEGAF